MKHLNRTFATHTIRSLNVDDTNRYLIPRNMEDGVSYTLRIRATM